MNPAAVLSIMVKTNGVSATTSDLRAVDDAGKKASGGLSKVAKVAGLGLAAGFGAGALAVKGLVKAASESEVSSAKMQAQLKALGIDYGKHAKAIDTVITKQSALSGLDDEDLQDSFTNIARVTGDVNEALKLNGLAADFARAKNIDVAKAGELVSKVAGGNVGVLGRYGIQVKKGATATEALALLQTKFAGQAKAYGDTAAGAQEKFGVAVENLQEALGQRLLPIVTKVAGGIADFVNGLYTGEGAGGKFVATIRGIVDAFVRWKDVLIPVGIAIGVVATGIGLYSAAIKVAAVAQAAFNAVMAANPITLVVLALGALVAAIIYAYRESETFRNIVNGAWTAIKNVAGPVIAWFAKAVTDAWDWIKTATKNLWDWFGPYLKVAWEVVKVAVTTYFKVYWTIIKGVWDAVKAVTTTLWDWFGPYLKVIWDAVKTSISIYFNAFKTVIGGIWDAIKTITKAAWDVFETLIVEPVKTAFGLVKSVLGNDGLLGWLKDHTADIKKAAELLAAPFVAAFDKMKGAVNNVLTFLGKVVDAVKQVIDFIGKIKLPSIKIPGIGGFGGGNVGPAGKMPSSVDGFNDDAARFGNVVTSGYRPGDDGWHGQNRARDYAGGNMLAFARYMASNFGSRLLELIHTPMGFGIKNGARVPLSFWGAAVNADHYDHVHVAMANGGLVKRSGWALVGERGPELAHLPSGTNVYSNRDSRAMVGGSEPVHVHVSIASGMEWLGQFIDVRASDAANRGIGQNLGISLSGLRAPAGSVARP